MPIKKYILTKSSQTKFEDWCKQNFKQEVKTYADKKENVIEIQDEAKFYQKRTKFRTITFKI